MDALTLTSAEPAPRSKKRIPIDPRPRFKPDRQGQADLIWGHLDSQIAAEHLARAVWRILETVDVSSVEARYSALGRHGYPPRRLLSLWVYASLVGEHEGSKVSARCQTDAAFRWLTGGHTPSPATVKRFRQRNEALFASALVHTVRVALDLELVDVADLAVDSVKLRAHASTKAARTLERSRKRLAELLVAPPLDGPERDRYEAKIKKHRDAIARCEAEGRSNFIVTNELAGLIKFPHGASWPGHRVTVTAAGVRSRLVLSVLIDADGNDYGKLVTSIDLARETLRAAGLPVEEKRFVAAADAGYFSTADLAQAQAEASWLDVLVAPSEIGTEGRLGRFGRDAFTIAPDLSPTCPAGRPMDGPHPTAEGDQWWYGIGCTQCPLRERCTPGARRKIRLNPDIERMRLRFADPTAKARYNKRIATVEPVFSNVLDTMDYRRATSRHAQTVRAEILLKLLSHNVARLITATRLRLVYVALDLN